MLYNYGNHDARSKYFGYIWYDHQRSYRQRKWTGRSKWNRYLPIGNRVSIEAIPADGHNFTGWSGIGAANSGLAATTVFMSNDRNLTANFAINEYNLVINPSNGGVENGAGIYEHGQQPTFPPIQILE